MPQQPRDSESLAAELLASAAAADAEAVRTVIENYLKTSGSEQIRTFIRPVVEEAVRAAMQSDAVRQQIRANAVAEVLETLAASLSVAKGSASSNARDSLTEEWTRALTSAAVEAANQVRDKVDLRPLRAAVRAVIEEEARIFLDERFPDRLAALDLDTTQHGAVATSKRRFEAVLKLKDAVQRFRARDPIVFRTAVASVAVIVLLLTFVLFSVYTPFAPPATRGETAATSQTASQTQSGPGPNTATTTTPNGRAVFNLRPALEKLAAIPTLGPCFAEPSVLVALIKGVDSKDELRRLHLAVRVCKNKPRGSFEVFLAQQVAIDYLNSHKNCSLTVELGKIKVDGFDGANTDKLLNDYIHCRQLIAPKPFSSASTSDDYLAIAVDAAQLPQVTGGQD